MQIISVDELCKELSLAYNLNIDSLRVHAQVIITILQEIVTSIKNHLILASSHEMLNQPTLSALLRPPTHEATN